MASRDKEAGRILDNSPRGISVVIGPDGAPHSEIMQNEEGVLYAEIDLSRCVEPKQYHDLVGGYNRFDIFQLTVNRESQRPISFLPHDKTTNHPAGTDLVE